MHALLTRTVRRLRRRVETSAGSRASVLIVLLIVAVYCSPASPPVREVEWRFREWIHVSDEAYLAIARQALRACGHDPDCFEVTLRQPDEIRRIKPTFPADWREAEFQPVHCKEEYPLKTGPLGGPGVQWPDDIREWSPLQRSVIERVYGDFKTRCPDCPERIEDLYFYLQERSDRLDVWAYPCQPFTVSFTDCAEFGPWSFSKEELDWPFRARVVFVRRSETPD